MGKPVRLQLSRRKGFDLQAASIALNGLPAVKVTRPGPWGNPYILHFNGDAETCVALFREAAITPTYKAKAQVLRGKNLACFCPLDAPCHADVLLEIANRTDAGASPITSLTVPVLMMAHIYQAERRANNRQPRARVN